MFRKLTRRPARRRSAKRCESQGTEALEVRLLLATFRTIDGSGNNQTVPGADFGVAGTNLIRSGYDAEFPDGFGDQITSATAPNPRTVSNTISNQNASVVSARNLSDWIVQWGQFITHDMDFTGTDVANNVLSTGATGTFSIPITDSNDPLGPNAIPFNRSDYDPTTGNSTLIPVPGPGNQTRPNWREQINDITSFIDASNVYGSDLTRANNLRTFVDGKLKTTAGGLLPGLNTAGEENDNAVGHDPTDLFLAGDVRANEAVGLTATHALFIREHNRLAGLLKAQNASLTDEEIYQWARKIVGAEMQIITYKEFLPALMGTSAPNPNAYVYKSQVDASVTTSFSTAFFRFGHSQQSSTLKLVNNDGSMAGEFSLASIFFNPDILQESPTLVDQVMKGLASQVSQENDILVVDEIRNFLFGAPGSGGLDLAVLDIQRGRDHGLLDYNEFRTTYGLQALTSFSQLTSDTALQAKLQTLYGNINNVDAWVGGIAENHLAGKSIGAMLNASFIEQFTRTRDGDRFFYTGDADLNNSLVTSVINLNNLTLASIIRNNTGIANIQDNVFFTAAGFSVVQTNGSTTVSESGTTDTFSVTLNRAPTSNVVLTVTTGDPGEATVDKTTLTFTPANWNVAQTVTVTGVDDAIVDGDQTFNITITVNDASSDNAFDPLLDQTVSVTTADNDVPALPALTVTLGENSISEKGGLTTFTVSRPASQTTGALTVTLTSNDLTEATVPTTVTIADGQTTSSPVTVTAVDDTILDGTQTVTLTVAAAGYTSGTGSLSVSDYEPLQVIIVDSAIHEKTGQTTTTLIVTRTDTTSTLTVTLLSSDTTEATIATSVVIAAGVASSGPVVVTGQQDNIFDGDQNITLTGSATGYVSAMAALKVIDDDVTVTATVPVITGPANETMSQRPTISWTAVAGAASYEVWITNKSTNTSPFLTATVAGTTWVPTSDLGIGSFLVWVRSKASTGAFAAWSAASNFKVLTQVTLNAIDMPQLTFRPTFTWNALPGTDHYDIWINSISNGVDQIVRNTNVTGTSFTATSDLPVGSYRVWVRGLAKDDTAAAWSSATAFSVSVAPTVTQGQNASFARIPELKWSALPGANHYDVWIDNLSTGTSQVIRNTNLASTTFTGPNTLPIGSYRAWVRGISNDGFAAAWTAAINFLINGSPTNTQSPSSTFNSKPTLAWNALAGATQYEVFIRNLTTGATTIDQNGITNVQFAPAFALATGPYRWWVRAETAQGFKSLWSAPIDFYIGGQTQLLTPTGTSNDTTPTFTWQNVDGFARYDLWVDKVGGQSQIIRQQSLTVATYTPTSALATGTYRAWIRAIATSGQISSWSSMVEFTVAAMDGTIDGIDVLPTGIADVEFRLTESDPELTSVVSPNEQVNASDTSSAEFNIDVVAGESDSAARRRAFARRMNAETARAVATLNSTLAKPDESTALHLTSKTDEDGVDTLMADMSSMNVLHQI